MKSCKDARLSKPEVDTSPELATSPVLKKTSCEEALFLKILAPCWFGKMTGNIECGWELDSGNLALLAEWDLELVVLLPLEEVLLESRLGSPGYGFVFIWNLELSTEEFTFLSDDGFQLGTLISSHRPFCLLLPSIASSVCHPFGFQADTFAFLDIFFSSLSTLCCANVRI